METCPSFLGIGVVDSIAIEMRHASRPAGLAGVRETIIPSTGVEIQTGYLDNLFVRYRTPDNLFVKGSLPVFLNGSNLEIMNKHDIREAVWRLSDRLDLNPHFARVFQIDLAATMPVPRPVTDYLSILASTPRYNRHDFEGSSVLYENNSRSMCFYDKGKEAQVAGSLLRFEVKYKKCVRKYFGLALVLADLYEDGFYRLMVQRWQTAYNLIRKAGRNIPLLVSTPRQLERQLARSGIDAYGGESKVIEMIDNWPLDRKKKSTLRQRIRGISDSVTSTQAAMLIAEFDAAVEEAVRLALSS